MPPHTPRPAGVASPSRRDFLNLSLLAGAALLAPRATGAADSRIEVLPDESPGTVVPEIFGHFVEHLGGVVYDGVWVGEGSKVANVGGVRKALVDHLRRLPASVMRWPGGCFADSYDWRDGVGPRSARGRRTNFWIQDMKSLPDGPWKYDPNTFGTSEFVRFCRLSGMEPYLAANLRSLPARDFYQWVEYCNSPAGSTSLAELRASAGDREPFQVRYWGVGNESWGCGGNFTPEEYATEYRRFTAWLPQFGPRLALIGSGPNGGDVGWTRRFLAKLVEKGDRQLDGLWGWGLHHYSWNVSGGRTGDWNQGKGDALTFPPEEWYELLHEADRMDSLIAQHWAVMGEIDRPHRVKLAVDEWGAWYRPGSEVHPSHLFGQVSTVRDALLAGLTLDTFIRHADKVAMANVAQLVNCLHSLFLAHEDRFAATPNFHVFEMYGAHAGGRAARVVVSAPGLSYARATGRGSLWGLAGSASLKNRTVTLTVVNPHLTEPREAEVSVRGASVASARALVLTAPDAHAHNTFDEPGVVAPRDQAVAPAANGSLPHRFPPASVSRLTLELA
jgi:alpha-L-arabinofuranosidase